jgi:hypothetical protein
VIVVLTGDQDSGQAGQAAVWACLHGIITLRADRPAFPWPPLSDMIDSLIRQILTTPPAAPGNGPPAVTRAAHHEPPPASENARE